MLDMPSPKRPEAVHLTAEQLAALQARRVRVWNMLIPRSAVEARIEPWGVRYRHPTKGWKTVGKKRFAIRGVV